jgi:hypothetical protein
MFFGRNAVQHGYKPKDIYPTGFEIFFSVDKNIRNQPVVFVLNNLAQITRPSMFPYLLVNGVFWETITVTSKTNMCHTLDITKKRSTSKMLPDLLRKLRS